MTFTIVSPLPNSKEILNEYPLSPKSEKRIRQHRQEIQDILEGRDSRLLLIIGPCSAWSDNAVIEYARKLKQETASLEETVKVVLRVYTQKPRTTLGWKGYLLHPDPFDKPNVLKGITYCRKMMLKIVNEIDLPIADEILYPDLALPYLSDLYSYGCIGARSSEHQRKRMIASGTDFPTGIKNPTSGDLTKAVQSVKVAQAPHAPFPHVGNIVTTQGNSHVHLVLRGGSGRPNYYPHALNLATQLLKEQNIKNPSIVVDLSHENSIGTDGEKDYLRQIPVGESVLRYRQSHPQNNIRGIMVESFLQAGKQTIPPSSQSIIPGKSLTDACLGWEDTQSFLQKITSFLS